MAEQQERGRPVLVSGGRRVPLNDAELANQALQGVTGAERAIWDRLAPPVKTFLSRIIGPEGSVEDALQEVFLRLFKKLPELRQPDKLRSFTFAIAANVARVEYRRRKIRRIVRLTRYGEPPDTTSASATPGMTLAVKQVYRILDRLTLAEREVFVLRYVEELGLEEIVEIVGASLATVKRRISAASEHLAKEVRTDPFLDDFLKKRRQGLGDGHE